MWHDVVVAHTDAGTGTAPARGARARARADITREIVRTARRHLAESGPDGLSLRAVARELGMVSSAVYRYVPSREALLTALIVDGYDDLGCAVEDAERGVRRSARARRFLVVCRTTRAWALDNPARWALLFGSPVPGYAAPRDTIEPASRIPRLLVQLLADAVAAGAVTPQVDRALGGRLGAAIAPAREFMAGTGVPDELALRGLMAWSHLVGSVSFELFGHRVGSVADGEVFFEAEMARVAEFTGLR